MKTEEITLIKSKHNAAIIAPAGHGKTEMITDLVDKLPGIKLVLTHTNAGVAALAKRFNKKNVNGEKYYLSTISSFCMKWTDAYPSTAGIRPDMKVTEKDFYSEIHIGTARIFTHSWARDIIAKTYNCVIVDEYQDCVLAQHQIFVELNKTVPVYVLGDPLQAIFGFKESLVSWKDICFDVLENEKGLVKGGRLYHNFLEAPFQGSVFLDDFPELVQGGCADALDISSCQSRLEHICCVEAS